MVVIGGSGVIGSATMKLLGTQENYSRKQQTLTLEEVAKKKMIFICLPTPAKKKEHDISSIEEYIQKLEKLGSKALYVVRSTTTPGQLRSLSLKFNTDRIVHFPEFLTMSTAIKDVMFPDIVVLGGTAENTEKVARVLRKIYRSKNHHPEYFQTDLTTSESIKCAINSFYALKVVFANELYDHSEKIGADYETIKNAMYKRKWVGNNHLDVYFNDKRGARGPCLPKDLTAFAGATKSKLLIVAKKLNDKLIS